MTGREDDAAIGLFGGNGNLGGGSGGQADVDNIEAHADEGSADTLVEHFARETGITTYNNLAAGVLGGTTYHGGVGSRELDDIKWVEAFADFAADSASNTGNRFDQTHMGGG